MILVEIFFPIDDDCFTFDYVMFLEVQSANSVCLLQRAFPWQDVFPFLTLVIILGDPKQCVLFRITL